MLDIFAVQEAYLANADYFAEQSVAKCKAFLTACNQLLVLLPAASKSGGGSETQWSIEAIEKRLAAAQSWLATRLDGTERTRLASFRDFRE